MLYASIARSRATWLRIVRSTSKKPYKKKALKTSWDLESETGEEVDTAHVCFMVNDNTPKITFEPSLDGS